MRENPPRKTLKGREECAGKMSPADSLIDINRWEGQISPLLMRTFSHMDVEELSAKWGSRKISAVTIESE